MVNSKYAYPGCSILKQLVRSSDAEDTKNFTRYSIRIAENSNLAQYASLLLNWELITLGTDFGQKYHVNHSPTKKYCKKQFFVLLTCQRTAARVHSLRTKWLSSNTPIVNLQENQDRQRQNMSFGRLFGTRTVMPASKHFRWSKQDSFGTTQLQVR